MKSDIWTLVIMPELAYMYTDKKLVKGYAEPPQGHLFKPLACVRLNTRLAIFEVLKSSIIPMEKIC